MEIMAEVPDGSVDMILADLPYGTTACKWDSVIPFEPLWAHYKRIAKKNAAIVLTASQPFTSALVMSNPKMFKYAWSWWKSHASGFQYAKHRPMQKHEDVLVFGQGKVQYNAQMRKGVPKASRSGEPETNRCPDTVVGAGVKANLSVVVTDDYYPTTQLYFGSGARAKSLHPTQKPVALMEYLIRTYTNEGETVLDNTMGSGTTGVACANTGRRFIGIEMDEKFFQIAKNRIEEAYTK